jgi:ParB family chromosome partitioning protein
MTTNDLQNRPNGHQAIAVAPERPAPSFIETLAAQLIDAAIVRIVPDPNQPRKSFDPRYIRGLADNIARNGLQNPIHLRPAGDDLMLMSGACRLEAFKLLKRTHIPAFVHAGELSGRQLRLLQVSENLLRDGGNPIEQALAFQDLLNGGTASQLAQELGVAVSTITRPLNLLRKLPADLVELVRQGILPGAAARVLTGLPDDEAKRRFARRCIDENLTRDQLASAIKAAKNGQASSLTSFTFRHEGVSIAVSLADSVSPAQLEAACRELVADLKKHSAPGWTHFIQYLEAKARTKAAEAKLQQAQDALKTHVTPKAGG